MMMSGGSAVRRSGAKIKAPRNAKPAEQLSETLVRLHLCSGAVISATQSTQARLSKAIIEIQSKNASKLSFEEHYRYAYNLVLHKHGSQLYESVKKLVSQHLENERLVRIQPATPGEASTSAGTSTAGTDTTSQGQAGERFLAAVKAVWDDHVACTSKLKDVLKYMDKVYTPSTVPTSLPTFALGLSLFQQHIVQKILDVLLKTMLAQIRLDRRGEAINKSAIRASTEMLVSLGGDNGPTVYKLSFEPVFLDETRTFYAEEASTLLDTDNVSASAYLLKVERRLEEEDTRTQHYLHASTDHLLSSLLEEILLSNHLDAIMRGLGPLIDENRLDDLRRMYRLLKRIGPGPPRLRRGVQEWITQKGRSLNEDPSLDAEEPASAQNAKGKEKESTALAWVQNVLQLKEQVDKLLHDAFSADKDMQRSMNDGFETFFKDNSRAPEYISLFLDENLKKGLKGKTEVEVDGIISATIALFRFLADKDLFERYYKSHLAKRLIHGRSVSDDAERSVLAKLVVESGAMFVRDLEGMIKDMKLSTDAANEYRRKMDGQGLDLMPTVCTASHWPLPMIAQACILPHDMAKSIDSFQAFYHMKHTGRKLFWRYELGTVDVRIQFDDRKREINLSTYGMVVMSLFGELAVEEQLSFNDIKTGTNIPADELRRTLQTLACGKYRILNKDPRGRDVNDTDRFSFNAAFTSPLTRIKILNIVNRVENKEQKAQTDDAIEKERAAYMEAVIVRTMKARKSMLHTDLVQEVIRQLTLRYQPTPVQVKLAIDRLISKEYLARNEADRKKYDYLA